MKTEISEQEINKAIAEAIGWRYSEPPTNDPSPAAWVSPDGRYPVWGDDLPDFVNDLNAMARAEDMLTERRWSFYVAEVEEILEAEVPESERGCRERHFLHAKAPWKAKAFLRTVNPTKAKELYGS